MVWKTVPDDRSATPKLRLPSSVAVSRPSALPDLHVPQNGDRLGQRDSPSICTRAGNMGDQHLGYS